MNARHIIALGLFGLAASAQASTPGAWDAMNQRVNRACIAMSGLARPTILAKQISFSDTLGVEARMLRGADNRGRFQRLLCLYRRSNGRTEVQEAGGWFGTTTKP